MDSVLLLLFDDCPRINLELYYIQNTVVDVDEHRKYWSLYWCEGYSLLPAPLPCPILFSNLLCPPFWSWRRLPMDWIAGLLYPRLWLGWVNGRHRHEIGQQKENMQRYSSCTGTSLTVAEICHDHSSHWIALPSSRCQLQQGSISFLYSSQPYRW